MTEVRTFLHNRGDHRTKEHLELITGEYFSRELGEKQQKGSVVHK